MMQGSNALRRMAHRIAMCLLVVCISARMGVVRAQRLDAPRMHTVPADSADTRRISNVRVSALGTATFLCSSAFLYRTHKDDFRTIRTNAGFTSYVRWDDYTPYVPLVACYTMKAAGVPSRSQWGRMVGTHVVATGMMMAITRPMKIGINSPRPNSSNTESLPSGHTATAFMMASMLDHEYGHISPWISVGGYTVATATGLGRILHNRHWVSDVLFGAGVGLMSTELAYLASDLVLGKRYLNRVDMPENYDRWHRPSYVGLRTGFTLPITRFGTMRLRSGSEAALEGAYYLSPYVGVGGVVGLSSNSIAMQDGSLDASFHTTNSNLWMQQYLPSVYGSYPVSRVLRLEGKCGVGYAHSSIALDPNRLSLLGHDDVADVAGSATHGIVAGVGASFHVTPSRRFDGAIYADWRYTSATPINGGLSAFNLGFTTAIRL